MFDDPTPTAETQDILIEYDEQLRSIALFRRSADMQTLAKSKFGTRLRAIREEQAMTQKELGDVVGMSAQGVARLESGVNEPTWPTVLKLARALGVTPDSFADNDEMLDPDG